VRWVLVFTAKAQNQLADLDEDREVVYAWLRSWQINDPPMDNPYDHGLSVRYREQAPSGQWVIYALDTASDPPSIDIYRID